MPDSCVTLHVTEQKIISESAPENVWRLSVATAPAQSHAAQSAAWPGRSLYGDILGTAPVTSGGPRLNIDATQH